MLIFGKNCAAGEAPIGFPGNFLGIGKCGCD